MTETCGRCTILHARRAIFVAVLGGGARCGRRARVKLLQPLNSPTTTTQWKCWLAVQPSEGIPLRRVIDRVS